MNTILHKKHSKRSLFSVLCTFLLCISLTLPVLASAKVDLASIEVANKSEISGDVYVQKDFELISTRSSSRKFLGTSPSTHLPRSKNSSPPHLQ